MNTTNTENTKAKYFYEKYLPENEFEIEQIIPNGNYFDYIAQEVHCRIPNSYTDYVFSMKDYVIRKEMLELLNKISNNDKGSSEILCFGYQIKAIKK